MAKEIKEKYSVYKHTSPSNKVYIGITKQNPEKRWQNGHGYSKNKYFYRAIKKYGWNNFKHEVLYRGLTKEEAEQKEIELITYYNSTNSRNGYNIDNGGNCIGSFSEEHKRKISEALTGLQNIKIRGENHPMYGKHLSEEVKNKISKSRKGKGGFPISEEHKKYLSELNSKPILQYSLDGKFIKEWSGATIASKELGIIRSNISACCAGSHKTAGGFIWKYKGDELEECDLDKHKPFKYQCKPINQYSLDGKFIKRYKSIKDAAIKNNFNNGSGDANIYYCCSGKTKTAYGFIWKYDGEELILEDHKVKMTKTVLQYTDDGKFLKQYNSIKEASMENDIDNGSITKCCKGQLKRAGGYIWKYVDEAIKTNEVC